MLSAEKSLDQLSQGKFPSKYIYIVILVSVFNEKSQSHLGEWIIHMIKIRPSLGTSSAIYPQMKVTKRGQKFSWLR